jgi:hypothetical protein
MVMSVSDLAFRFCSPSSWGPHLALKGKRFCDTATVRARALEISEITGEAPVPVRRPSRT